MGILSKALCPLWFFLCVPCGKTFSYFFYHKVHKAGYFKHSLVSLVVKFLAIFLTTKFTRIYTKFTKLDGYYSHSLVSLVVSFLNNKVHKAGWVNFSKQKKRPPSGVFFLLKPKKIMKNAEGLNPQFFG